jgi:hypothetical protein
VSVQTETIAELIRNGDLQRLFIEELGWDRPKVGDLDVDLGDHTYRFRAIAEKQGFTVPVCDEAPDHRTRQRLHRMVSQRTAEHFAIYGTPAGRQYWQWTELRSGRPPRLVTHEWRPDRLNLALLERLTAIGFDLAEEGTLNLLGVRRRVGAAFSADKVSARFYKDFQDEHAHLLRRIQGIELEDELEWYASVLLNRLMFLYFIQKRRYLDGDPDYLRNRFERVRAERGPGHFYTFFQHFLLPLFQDALARREPSLEDASLAEMVGDVPYVNGGFFSVHELERKWPIDVSDDAFDRIFKLFDGYRWHLTDVTEQDERAINPDVLGYVFERYVNQKDKGAYYTKTDVTRFMVRSALLPVFLDRWEALTTTHVRIAGPRWDLLRETPDRYVPAGLAHGTGEAIPTNLEAAAQHWPATLDLLDSAPESVALPSETWLEVVDRRARWSSLRDRLAAGEIRTASDALTANVALPTFAVDAVLDVPSVETALAVLSLIQDLRIIDPACGSGAFLFAALNVLEELYEAAITALRDLPPSSDGLTEERRRHWLADIDSHASRSTSSPNRRPCTISSASISCMRPSRSQSCGCSSS